MVAGFRTLALATSDSGSKQAFRVIYCNWFRGVRLRGLGSGFRGVGFRVDGLGGLGVSGLLPSACIVFKGHAQR